MIKKILKTMKSNKGHWIVDEWFVKVFTFQLTFCIIFFFIWMIQSCTANRTPTNPDHCSDCTGITNSNGSAVICKCARSGKYCSNDAQCNK